MRSLRPTLQTLNWRESIRFAVGALRVDKLKAFLTMLSVIVGSASVVAVVSIASTGKAYILAQIEGIGSNLAYASLNRGPQDVLEDELTPEDLESVRHSLPMVTEAAATYDISANYQLHGQVHLARLVGVTQGFQHIRKLLVTSGRYFDEEDFRSRAKGCVITDRIAETVFGHETALGSDLQLGEFRCTIIGTFREGVPTFGQSEIQDQTVLVPFPLVSAITGDNFFQVIYVQAASSSEVPEMTDQLRDLLRSRHRKQARYSVDNLSSLLQTADKASLALTIVLLAVAVLTLTVAGTGIMNIMLVNVTERTREIGVRMALGARPAEIRLQFLLEGIFISFGGAVLGVLFALGLVWSSGRWIPGGVPPSISGLAVATSLTLTTGVGVLFGYWPANEAAMLDPIEALRNE